MTPLMVSLLPAEKQQVLRFAQDDNFMAGIGLKPALVEQVLSPLIVGVAHQAHDVAAGVEIEGARFAGRAHVGFVRELIAFAAVAGMAAGYEIFPGGESAAGAWNYVVEREFAGGQRGAAILAGVAVAQQNVLARQCARLVRNAAVFEQADD